MWIVACSRESVNQIEKGQRGCGQRCGCGLVLWGQRWAKVTRVGMSNGERRPEGRGEARRGCGWQGGEVTG